MSEKTGLVVIATPTITGPFPAYLAALEASRPTLEALPQTYRVTYEIGNPYISAARANLLRKAMDGHADAVVFIDHDLSWEPADLVKLIEAPGEVVAGLYRFKKDDEEYMGAPFDDEGGNKLGRPDGAILGNRVPGGFLKITRQAVERFMRAYPELVYGSPINPSVDLFNHGAFEGVWYGEDYAFSRRWKALGEPLWIMPDLNLTHHSPDKAYPGNYHNFLRRQPGGDLAEAA